MNIYGAVNAIEDGCRRFRLVSSACRVKHQSRVSGIICLWITRFLKDIVNMLALRKPLQSFL